MIVNLNLLPWREHELKVKNQIYGVFAGIVISIAVAFSYGVKNFVGSLIMRQQLNNQFITKETQQIERQIKNFIDIEKEQNKLVEKIGTLQRLQANRAFIVMLLNKLAKITPSDMIIKKLSRNGDSLLLEGFISDNAAITNFIKNIEATEWMHSPNLEGITSTFRDNIGVEQVDVNSLSKFVLEFQISEKKALELIVKDKGKKDGMG